MSLIGLVRKKHGASARSDSGDSRKKAGSTERCRFPGGSLRIPPGNNLESLKGNRQGQHSIRISEQFRICFIWADPGPERVEITDDH